MDWKERIIADPSILNGKPAIKGTRIAASFVLELFAAGWDEAKILTQYPQLTRDDILAVFAYSASQLKDEELAPLKDVA